VGFGENFGIKEVGCGSKIGSSQNRYPSWPPSPKNLFEYKTKKKTSY